MIKTIIISVLLVCLSPAKGDIISWTRSMLTQPGNYFRTSYEQAIFLSFTKRHGALKVLNAIRDNSRIFVSYDIPGESSPYSLIFVIDEDKLVRYVYRNPEDLSIQDIRSVDKTFLIWMGKFFYRLDAGDGAALRDLIFFTNVKMSYNGAANKKKIIKKMINDFSGVVRPYSLLVKQKKQQKYYFHMTIPLRTDLRVEIPFQLIHETDTDYLQDRFYKEIISQIENDSENFPNYNGSFLIDRYRIVQDMGKNRAVRYNIKRFNKVKYLLFDGNSLPLIDITFDPGNQVLWFNDYYSFSYYRQHDGSSLSRLNEVTQHIFRFLMGDPVFYKALSENLPGVIRYRGLELREIILKKNIKWMSLINLLWQKGILYYYPSHIDDFQTYIIQKGLIYIILKDDTFHYHFAEIQTTFDKTAYGFRLKHIDMAFYPFVKDDVKALYDNNIKMR